MRAVRADHAQPPIAGAKCDQVLTEQPHHDGCAVAFGDFLGEAGGQPVAAHDLPHRGIVFHATQEVVLFGCEHHGSSLRRCRG